MYDIVIIGYGPVGATLANLLGSSGWRIAIIERNREVFPIPRAVHCDDEAQRIWQAAGLTDLVKPSFGGYPPDRQYINARGKVYFATKLSTARPYGHQPHMYFHQPLLEEGLRQGVARFDQIEIFSGWQATALTQTAAEASVEITNLASSEAKTIRAQYIIGCDGGRSFTRKALDIKLRDLKFEQPWLVTDFYLKAGLTREDVGFPYAHQQICDPNQPISFIPNGTKSHYRFEFMLPPGVTKEEAEKPSYVSQKLSLVVDTTKIDIVRGAVYTFHSLIAEKWRHGRIFIAGDAAHQMPPFAGQGMVSGLRDAQNLSWKLSLVLSGRAPESLLDSYEQERKPHVTRMTQGAMFLGNLVQTQNRFRALLRDILFQTIFKIPALFGRIARFALRAPALQTDLRGGSIPAVIGLWFPQPEVTTPSGAQILLDDLLGSDFAVLALDRNPAPHFTNLDHKLPIRYLNIASQAGNSRSHQLLDHTGQLSIWFRKHKAQYIILRPDRFVFAGYTEETIGQASDQLLNQFIKKQT